MTKNMEPIRACARAHTHRTKPRLKDAEGAMGRTLKPRNKKNMEATHGDTQRLR